MNASVVCAGLGEMGVNDESLGAGLEQHRCFWRFPERNG